MRDSTPHALPQHSPPRIVPGATWERLARQVRELVPEAFDSAGRVLNLVGGEWSHPGRPRPALSPCDGSDLGTYPMLDLTAANRAVDLAATEHDGWARIDLDERRRRVGEVVADLRQHRDVLAFLLVWEIGKPYQQALVSVDRCVAGVEWYLEHIESMLDGRKPLGLVSNVASWNYPLSVLVHAVLVQLLAGNTTIVKTPTDGGLFALTLALGLARRRGLPVSLISGSGGELSEALVLHDRVAALAFVGGKTSGRDIAARLHGDRKRYMLEMEGVNAYGIWDFSDWPGLARQLKKGFEYGKQRCTAYVRYVIQRDLFPAFLRMYLPVVAALEVGHPLLVRDDAGTPPAVDFGPLINARTVDQLREMYREALAKGAVSIYEGRLDESRFFPEQDRSAYLAPAALLNVPRNCALYHQEPFGPIDTIVIVDRIEELIAEMNVSNGNLVASIACDTSGTAQRIAGELRAFKVGVNAPRSRGDREEPFGGVGESWKGCFVGGPYLIRAVTQGAPGERLHGNFTDYSLLPETR